MQSLNIHDAKNVSISPMQQHNTARWITITIIHNEGVLEINLFPKTSTIDLTLEGYTHCVLEGDTHYNFEK